MFELAVTMFGLVGGVPTIFVLATTIRRRAWKKHVRVDYDGTEVPYDVLSDVDTLMKILRKGIYGPNMGINPNPRLDWTWESWAHDQRFKWTGGPDVPVLLKGEHIGMIQIGYDPDESQKDKWEIKVIRADGSEIGSARQILQAPPSTVFSTSIRNAVDHLCRDNLRLRR